MNRFKSYIFDKSMMIKIHMNSVMYTKSSRGAYGVSLKLSMQIFLSNISIKENDFLIFDFTMKNIK